MSDKEYGAGQAASDTASTALLASLANRALNFGAERALGVQRYVHGTSPTSVNKILAGGFDPSLGGKAGGGAAAVDDANYIKNSTGYAHVALDNMVGRQFIANAHGSLATAESLGKINKDKKKAVRAFFLGALTPRIFGNRKQRVGGAMSHASFGELMVPDLDQIPGLAFKTKTAIGPENLTRSRAGLTQILRAFKDVDLKSYIKKNPGRFASGAGGLAGAAGLAAIAKTPVENLFNALKSKLSDGEKSASTTDWRDGLSQPLLRLSQNKPGVFSRLMARRAEWRSDIN